MELNQYLRLILAALTCYRLAQFISLDTGPMGIFRAIREGAERFLANKRDSRARQSLAELASCPYCQGLYIGLGCLALVIFPTFWGDLVLIWLGIVGLQAFMQSVGGRE